MTKVDPSRIPASALKGFIRIDETGRVVSVPEHEARQIMAEIIANGKHDVHLRDGSAGINMADQARQTFDAIKVPIPWLARRIESEEGHRRVSYYAEAMRLMDDLAYPAWRWLEPLQEIRRRSRADFEASWAFALEDLWKGAMAFFDTHGPLLTRKGWSSSALLRGLVERRDTHILVWSEDPDARRSWRDSFWEKPVPRDPDSEGPDPLDAIFWIAGGVDTSPQWLWRRRDEPEKDVRIALPERSGRVEVFEMERTPPHYRRLEQAPLVWALYLIIHDVCVDTLDGEAVHEDLKRSFVPLHGVQTTYPRPEGERHVSWPLPRWPAMVDIDLVVRSIVEVVPALREVQSWSSRSHLKAQAHVDSLIAGLLRNVVDQFEDIRKETAPRSIRISGGPVSPDAWKKLGERCSQRTLSGGWHPQQGRRFRATERWMAHYAPCYASPELGLSKEAAEHFCAGWRDGWGGADGQLTDSAMRANIHAARLSLLEDFTDPEAYAFVKELYEQDPEHPFHRLIYPDGFPPPDAG